MTTIHVSGDFETRRVWINDMELLPEKSLSVINHSPDGFNWGYSGSGPSQLALAICIRIFGEDKAKKVYMRFKGKHIATLPQKDFECDMHIHEYEHYMP